MATATKTDFQTRIIGELSYTLGYRRMHQAPCTTWGELGRDAAFTYIAPVLVIAVPAAVVVFALITFPFIQKLF